MTPAFLAAAAALLLVALALLLRPYLLRRKPGTALTQRRINIAIYRDQLDELERDRADGALSESDYATAREEIQRRLLEDGSADDAATVASTNGRGTLVAIVLTVSLLGGGLYAWLGNPAGLNPPKPKHQVSAAEIDDMVAKLAAKLEKEDNPQGWVMLARSYKMLGRLEEAAKAYGRAGGFIDNEPSLLADYADVLVAGSATFVGKPRELLTKALKLDPDHVHSLWLSGTAEFEAGKFNRAIADWERLLKQLPPDSDEARSVQNSIAEARTRGDKSAPQVRGREGKAGNSGKSAPATRRAIDGNSP